LPDVRTLETFSKLDLSAKKEGDTTRAAFDQLAENIGVGPQEL
jgi:hypothetical protein